MQIETDLSKESLFVATTQLEVREVGNNGGQAVARYLKSVGLSVGNPWCMSFVYWCVNIAAARLKVLNPLVKTGHVMTQYNTTTCRKIPNRSAAIKPGDIFILDLGGGTGHTGFVESINGSVITTIEGNSNDEGVREGYEVVRRERSITAVKGFIQL